MLGTQIGRKPGDPKHVLDRDSLIALYGWLWKHKDRLSRSSIPPFAETIIYEHHFPRAWYAYGSGDTLVGRKSAKEADTTSIYEAFTRGVAVGAGDIVAEFRWRDDLVDDVQVLCLTAKELYAFLIKPYEKGVLQRFIRPNGECNEGIAVTWTPFLCFAERWQSVHALNDHRVPLDERVIVANSAHCKEIIIAPHILQRIKSFCASFVEDFVALERKEVKRMVMHFKLDPGMTLWLLQTTQIDTSVVNVAKDRVVQGEVSDPGVLSKLRLAPLSNQPQATKPAAARPQVIKPKVRPAGRQSNYRMAGHSMAATSSVSGPNAAPLLNDSVLPPLGEKEKSDDVSGVLWTPQSLMVGSEFTRTMKGADVPKRSFGSPVGVERLLGIAGFDDITGKATRQYKTPHNSTHQQIRRRMRARGPGADMLELAAKMGIAVDVQFVEVAEVAPETPVTREHSSIEMGDLHLKELEPTTMTEDDATLFLDTPHLDSFKEVNSREQELHQALQDLAYTAYCQYLGSSEAFEFHLPPDSVPDGFYAALEGLEFTPVGPHSFTLPSCQPGKLHTTMKAVERSFQSLFEAERHAIRVHQSAIHVPKTSRSHTLSRAGSRAGTPAQSTPSSPLSTAPLGPTASGFQGARAKLPSSPGTPLSPQTGSGSSAEF